MDKNNRKSDILTIVKEDILRILGEEEGIVSIDSIRDELKVLDDYVEILSNVVDEKSHTLPKFTMQPPPLLSLHQQISYSPILLKSVYDPLVLSNF